MGIFRINVENLHWLENMGGCGDENVRLIVDSGKEEVIPLNEYRAEVFRFANQTEAFYKNSLPKKCPTMNLIKRDMSHFGMNGTDGEKDE